MSLTVKVYTDRTNAFDLVFRTRNTLTGVVTAVDFSAVSEMRVTILDGSDEPQIEDDGNDGYIDWTDASDEGRVRFTLGQWASLPDPGEYRFRVDSYSAAGGWVTLVHEDMGDDNDLWMHIEESSATA